MLIPPIPTFSTALILLLLSACSDSGGTGGKGADPPDTRDGGASESTNDDGGGVVPPSGDGDGEPTAPIWADMALPAADTIDLTLGGLNEDLAPPDACLFANEPSIACIDFVGEFDGVRFEGCSGNPTSAASRDAHTFGCRATLASGNELRIGAKLSVARLGDLPGSLLYTSPPDTDEDTGVSVTHTSPKYYTFAEDTHDVDARLAAVSGLGPGSGNIEVSGFERGTFALTAVPRDDCVPDADGQGCATVRIRGNFTARTVWSAQ